eukprot:GDKH01017773.1.p1 GENE.GDKH01017773.1~~GDKH01017773.1.p1  ORF type:complete len:103 (+),score=25.07 GDKH01017773.1:78-386(+)
MRRTLFRMASEASKMESTLTEKIQKGLGTSHFRIVDNSGGCGASFDTLIVSQEFEGKRLLARQRLVNDAIKEEMPQIHAFTMKCMTPAEWEKVKDQPPPGPA